jgi:hypothetical protein
LSGSLEIKPGENGIGTAVFACFPIQEIAKLVSA